MQLLTTVFGVQGSWIGRLLRQMHLQDVECLVLVHLYLLEDRVGLSAGLGPLVEGLEAVSPTSVLFPNTS